MIIQSLVLLTFWAFCLEQFFEFVLPLYGGRLLVLVQTFAETRVLGATFAFDERFHGRISVLTRVLDFEAGPKAFPKF